MPVVTINGTTVKTDILMLLEATEISRTLSGGRKGKKGGYIRKYSYFGAL